MSSGDQSEIPIRSSIRQGRSKVLRCKLNNPESRKPILLVHFPSVRFPSGYTTLLLSSWAQKNRLIVANAKNTRFQFSANMQLRNFFVYINVKALRNMIYFAGATLLPAAGVGYCNLTLEPKGEFQPSSASSTYPKPK
jgi:hypothetical protein